MKCEANDSCMNKAEWLVGGRFVNSHVCCDDCKKQWESMSFSKGGVTFRRITETKHADRVGK